MKTQRRGHLAAGAAFSVHLLTASGSFLAFLSLVAASEERWTAMFWWLGLALFVDGIDGPIARKLEVKEILPTWSGELLDNIIDYVTYVLIPAFALYQRGFMGEGLSFLSAAIIVVSSAIYYADTGMKTKENFFKGFPVVWNMVVFTLFVIEPGEWVSFARGRRRRHPDLRAGQFPASGAGGAAAADQSRHHACSGALSARWRWRRRHLPTSTARSACSASNVSLFTKIGIAVDRPLSVLHRRHHAVLPQSRRQEEPDHDQSHPRSTPMAAPKCCAYEDVDPGSPAPGEALIRHTAIGLNFLDVYYRSGLYPPPGGLPLIPGSEAAGVVVEAGEGVDG